MIDPKAFSEYEASGVGIAAIVAGFKRYPTVAFSYLERYGIAKKDQEIDTSAWYPFGPWLAALHAMTDEVGANSMYRIGRSVPESAVFPPHVNDIHTAIQSVDAAYRMNHRKNGVLLLDPSMAGKAPEVGQYKYEAVPGENQIRCICDNPYPCDLDRGLVGTMAARFEPQAKTQHDTDSPCRKTGGRSCTYVIFW